MELDELLIFGSIFDRKKYSLHSNQQKIRHLIYYKQHLKILTMKKTCSLIIAIFYLISFSAYTQWEPHFGQNSRGAAIETIYFNNKFYIACTYAGLFETDAYGNKWKQIFAGAGEKNGSEIHSFVIKDGLMILGTKNKGIQVTSNAGQTWKNYLGDVDVFYATYENKKYFVNYYDFSKNKSYFVSSTDNGLTWTENFVSNLRTLDIKKIENSKGRLVLAANNIYYSTDNGSTWQEEKKIGQPIIQDFIVEDDLIMFSSNTGLLFTEDFGKSWKTEKPQYNLYNLTKKGNLIVGSDGGTRVSVSFDNGKNWSDFSDGLTWVSTGNSTNTFTIVRDTLFMGSELSLSSYSGAGFWKRPLSELSSNYIKAPTFLKNSSASFIGSTSSLSTISLSWVDNSLIEDGFIIERASGLSGSFVEIAKVDSSATISFDLTAESGIYYRYQVKSTGKNYKSKPSNIAEAFKIKQCDLVELNGIGNLINGQIFDENSISIYATQNNSIISTSDLGKHWKNTPISNNIRQVNFNKKNIFFGLGQKLKGFYKTSDGGKTWQFIASNILIGNDNFNANFQFINEKTGFTVSEKSSIGRKRVYKTSDGGAIWQEIPISQIGDSYIDVGNCQFSTENTGIAQVDQKHYLTKDGGRTWGEIIVKNNESIPQFINSFKIFDDKNLLVSGNKAVWKTSDAGKTWSMYMIDSQLPANSYISTYYFSDEKTGFARIENTNIYITNNTPLIYQTIDGGESWSKKKTGNFSLSKRLLLINKSTWFNEAETLDKNLFLSQNAGESWAEVSRQIFRPKKIKFISENIGYAINRPFNDFSLEKFNSPESYFYKTDDAGVSWKPFRENFLEREIDMHFFDNQNGVLITSYNTYSTNDGGKNWSLVNRNFLQDYYKNQIYVSPVFKFINQNFWISYKISSIESPVPIFHVTRNGGKTWETVSLPNLNTVNIYFYNENIGFVASSTVSSNQTLLHKTTDGGKTWNLIKTSNTKSNESIIYFHTDKTGYFKEGQNLLKTTDGGTSWKKVFVNPNSITDSGQIYFVNDQVGYISSSGILKTTDGGETWMPISNSINSSDFLTKTPQIRTISKYNETTIAAASDYGGIYLITPSGIKDFSSNFSINGVTNVCAGQSGKFTYTNDNSEINMSWVLNEQRLSSYFSGNDLSVFFPSKLQNTSQKIYLKATNGCFDKIKEMTVKINPLPTTIATQKSPGIFEVDTDDNVQWYQSSNFKEIPNATKKQFIPSANGTYYAVITSNAGCKSTTNTLSVIITSMFEEPNTFVDIYPNPSSDKIIINSAIQMEKILILSSEGRHLKEISAMSKNSTINISEIPLGTFIIRILYEDKSSTSHKIIKSL